MAYLFLVINMATAAQQNVAHVVEAYIDIWNDRDYARIPDVVAESFAMAEPAAPGGVIHGHDALEQWIRTMATGFSDFELTIDDILVGDSIAMWEGTFRGTHDGVYEGLEPTGRHIEMHLMDKMRVEDGKLQAEWSYYDTAAFAEQLGLAAK